MKYLLFVILVFIGFATFPQANKGAKSFSGGLGSADYSFNIGSQVGAGFNNSYWFTNYFSPSAKVDLTKRVSIVAGVGVAYTQLNNFQLYNLDSGSKTSDATLTSFYTYASGIYKLNPKIDLNATIMLEQVLINSPETPVATQKQFKDVSFGFNYNITKKISINAQMQISNRPNHGYYNNSFSGFGTNSPFLNTSFY